MAMDEKGGRSERFGDDLVSEKFPAGAYFGLKGGIWNLAKVMLPDEINNTIAPATVRAYPRRVGALAADLSIDFDRHEVTKSAVPSRFTAILFEIEPYRSRPDSELWFWRRFSVVLVKPGLSFARGASIVGRHAVVYVKSGASVPPEQGAGEEAWRSAQYLERSTSDDYHWFMKNLSEVTAGLQGG